MSFSPFNENILATASQDTTVKIKIIPEEGFTETSNTFDACLKGHTKKVMLCKWHPSASYTIASCSFSGNVKIWDVQKETDTMTYEQTGSAPWSMQWNYDGSLLSCINKNKKMHIFDPRSP